MASAHLARELGQLLSEKDYSEEGLTGVLGAPPDRALDPDYLPSARYRARDENGPLGALAEAFLLGREVSVDGIRAALAPLDPQDLVRAGLLASAPSGVVAPLHILPYEGLLLAFDPPDGSAGGEEVTAPVPAARTLAAVTVRREVGSALDLGSGGGVQGLLLAPHADHVVLTDVSTRAREIAELNVALNDLGNVELRTGDWFDPVAGERFDLIAANLPYVVSPDLTYTYRDNPHERDELSRRIVGQVADYLADDGFAHVLCSWTHGREEEWAERPLAWVRQTRCDALILHYASHEPLEYAASWNRPLQRRHPQAFEETLDRWLAYYEEAGIERIATGVIILRRRSGGRPWHRPVEVPDAPTGLAGAHVERLFTAQDQLASLSGPEALLSARLRAAPGQRLDQAMLYHDGGYLPDSALMRCHPGIGVVARIDPRVMPVVVGCDGRRPLGELINGAVQGLGATERAELGTLCFATMRTAFELGLLEGTG